MVRCDWTEVVLSAEAQETRESARVVIAGDVVEAKLEVKDGRRAFEAAASGHFKSGSTT